MLKVYSLASSKLAEIKNRVARDERGASLVEYSVLIGLITVAAVASISTVGGWVATQWNTLVTTLNAG